MANNVADENDLALIGQLLAAEPDLVIPQDETVRVADRDGASPVDYDTQSQRWLPCAISHRPWSSARPPNRNGLPRRAGWR